MKTNIWHQHSTHRDNKGLSVHTSNLVAS